jgi:hypothetical protein
MLAFGARIIRCSGLLAALASLAAGSCSVSERDLGASGGSGEGGQGGSGTGGTSSGGSGTGGSGAPMPLAGASGEGGSPELGQGGGGLGGTEAADAAAPASGLVSQVWSVGSQGNGPGFFGPTARSVGVDRNGYIYVGEWDVSEFTGPERVQVFDANGDFVRQWNFQGDGTFITGMTVDQNGILSSVQDWRIFRYDGRTGALIGEFTYDDDNPATPPLMLFPDVLTVTPENELVAVSNEAIVRFNELGVIELANLEELEQTLEGAGALPNGVAVDGDGNIYVADRFELSILKFSSNAVFQDRISSEGAGPGKLASGPGSIAIDGRGRIYAMEYEEGIEVFDAAGDSLGVIPFDGYAYSMAVSLNNELIVIDADNFKLTKYAINP